METGWPFFLISLDGYTRIRCFLLATGRIEERRDKSKSFAMYLFLFLILKQKRLTLRGKKAFQKFLHSASIHTNLTLACWASARLWSRMKNALCITPYHS